MNPTRSLRLWPSFWKSVSIYILDPRLVQVTYNLAQKYWYPHIDRKFKTTIKTMGVPSLAIFPSCLPYWMATCTSGQVSCRSTGYNVFNHTWNIIRFFCKCWQFADWWWALLNFIISKNQILSLITSCSMCDRLLFTTPPDWYNPLFRVLWKQPCYLQVLYKCFFFL